MELMTGGELIEKEGSKGTEENAVFYFTRVVKAIQHCNAQNIVHRDIKPENIMFDVNKSLKLAETNLKYLYDALLLYIFF